MAQLCSSALLSSGCVASQQAERFQNHRWPEQVGGALEAACQSAFRYGTLNLVIFVEEVLLVLSYRYAPQDFQLYLVNDPVNVWIPHHNAWLVVARRPHPLLQPKPCMLKPPANYSGRAIEPRPRCLDARSNLQDLI